MINFGKWSSAGTKYFLMDRIYFKGYIWTPFIKMKIRKNKSTLEALRDVMNVQSQNGNWNYDEYMHGMYNGMELMLSLSEGREPNYRSAPDKWLRDKVQEHMDVIGVETQSNGGLH